MTATTNPDHPKFLRPPLNAYIETQHGSVERYVRNELGISAGDIAVIRAELLD
jgi:hypothetical protein